MITTTGHMRLSIQIAALQLGHDGGQTYPIGPPEKPLSDTQFEAKFRDCARNAVRPLSDLSVDAVLASIGRLETLADARELLTPFAE